MSGIGILTAEEVSDFIEIDLQSQIVQEFRRVQDFARRLVDANHVFEVHIKKKKNGFEVFPLCIQGSDVHGKPHKLYAQIELVDNKNKISGRCSCKAGNTGKCKHFTAVLLKLERIRAEEIQDSTCTQLPQVWGQTGRSVQCLFNPVPVAEFCHIKHRKRIHWNEHVNSEVLANVKRIIYEGGT